MGGWVSRKAVTTIYGRIIHHLFLDYYFSIFRPLGRGEIFLGFIFGEEGWGGFWHTVAKKYIDTFTVIHFV